MQKYYSQEGTKWPETKLFIASKMLMVTQFIVPIISFWISTIIRCNFLGEITEFAANIIAESMYAQCNVDGNEYLLLEAFINHRKNGSALSVKD